MFSIVSSMPHRHVCIDHFDKMRKENGYSTILYDLLSIRSKILYFHSKKTFFFYKSLLYFCFHCSYAFVNTSNSCFPNIAKITVFKFCVCDNSRATVDIATGAASFNG